MYIAIEEILKKKGITLYWLSKKLDCNYYSLQKLYRNQTNSISFDLMEKLCKALNVLPSDIFKLEE